MFFSLFYDQFGLKLRKTTSTVAGTSRDSDPTVTAVLLSGNQFTQYKQEVSPTLERPVALLRWSFSSSPEL